MTELDKIGEKVRICFDAITAALEETGLTAEEIAQFQEYLDRQDAIMPLTDPTQYIRGGQEAIVVARERVTAVKNCLLIREIELEIIKVRKGR